MQWIWLHKLFFDRGKVTTVTALSMYDNMCSGVGIHDVGDAGGRAVSYQTFLCFINKYTLDTSAHVTQASY